MARKFQPSELRVNRSGSLDVININNSMPGNIFSDINTILIILEENTMNLNAESPHFLFSYLEQSVINYVKKIIIHINFAGRFGRSQFCLRRR